VLDDPNDTESFKAQLIRALYLIARHGGHQSDDDHFFSRLADADTGRRQSVLPSWARKIVKEVAVICGYNPDFFGLRSPRIAAANALIHLGPGFLKFVGLWCSDAVQFYLRDCCAHVDMEEMLKKIDPEKVRQGLPKDIGAPRAGGPCLPGSSGTHRT
jgi:hypothetical protein